VHAVTKFRTAKFGWQILLLVLGALAIITHLAFRIWLPAWAKWPLLVVIALGALPLIVEILLKLLRKDVGADILAGISIVAAFILGEYLACVLVMLMLAGGQALEAFALGRASSVLQELAGRMPNLARRKRGNQIDEIDVQEIAVDDLIVIAPHETCPADGVVIEGHGFMDESYLTGEPYRVGKAPGTNVISGAVNGESVLLMRVERLPKDSRYARIIAVMQEAEQKRPKLRRLGDQLGAIFAPISLVLAVSAWIFTADPMRFLSVLVIATPCPLLIAIPVALISAISMAARRGIIISDPLVLERLPTCKTAIFDKTGTLTYGQPVLTEIIPENHFTKDEILRKVASVEQYSKHPLATAIIDAAHKRHLYSAEAKSVSERPGLGLVGTVEESKIAVTGRQQILLAQPELASSMPPPYSGLECIVLIDDAYAGCMRFHDAPRSDSRSFVSHLGPFHSFQKVMLVSGDRASEVAYLAAQLGITDTLASQSPEQKLATVLEETKKAATLFMGDGVNDAPALRAATVGIAFGQPASATREAAGAVVMENSLSKVDELLHLSHDMRRIALQSAVGGMALSIIGMGFATVGLISPVAGALLQQAIDAAAILNAMRLTWQRDVAIDLQQSPNHP